LLASHAVVTDQMIEEGSHRQRGDLGRQHAGPALLALKQVNTATCGKLAPVWGRFRSTARSGAARKRSL
jgi:hypothetical protein